MQTKVVVESKEETLLQVLGVGAKKTPVVHYSRIEPKLGSGKDSAHSPVPFLFTNARFSTSFQKLQAS